MTRANRTGAAHLADLGEFRANHGHRGATGQVKRRRRARSLTSPVLRYPRQDSIRGLPLERGTTGGVGVDPADRRTATGCTSPAPRGTRDSTIARYPAARRRGARCDVLRSVGRLATEPGCRRRTGNVTQPVTQRVNKHSNEQPARHMGRRTVLVSGRQVVHVDRRAQPGHYAADLVGPRCRTRPAPRACRRGRTRRRSRRSARRCHRRERGRCT